MEELFYFMKDIQDLRYSEYFMQYNDVDDHYYILYFVQFEVVGKRRIKEDVKMVKQFEQTKYLLKFGNF